MQQEIVNKTLRQSNLTYLSAVRESGLSDISGASKLFLMPENFCRMVVSLSIADIDMICCTVTVPLCTLNKMEQKFTNEIIKILSDPKFDQLNINQINTILLNGAANSERC
jgi:hypothetical protein